MIISDEKLEEIKKESTEFVDRLKDRVHEQYEEIERLKLELDSEKSNSAKAYKRIVKAVEYIKNNYPVCAGKDLLDILEGSDKE